MEICFCFILSHNQHPKHDQPVVSINITRTEDYEHYAQYHQYQCPRWRPCGHCKLQLSSPALVRAGTALSGQGWYKVVQIIGARF